jgi:hypothetical protein
MNIIAAIGVATTPETVTVWTITRLSRLPGHQKRQQDPREFQKGLPHDFLSICRLFYDGKGVIKTVFHVRTSHMA